jgi:hypothetical protein
MYDLFNAPKLSDFSFLFENVVSGLLALGGIVLFVMFLIGGMKYLLAGSDAKAAEGAKNTLTYAIAGMVLLAASFMILKVIENFTGTTVTEFNIVHP